jgi:opacity protein-like surface antigen
MNTKLTTILMSFCIWAIVLLYPASLAAQNVPFRISLFGGLSFLDSERAFVLNDVFFRSDFQNGVTVGVRGTADMSDALAVEASYGLSTNDVKITNEGPPRREREFDLNVHRLDGNVNYRFTRPDDPLRPFVTAGIGLARFSPTNDAKQTAATLFIEDATRISSSNLFSLNFGAGVEGQISESIDWRADLRDHMSGMPRFGVPETPLSPGGVSFPVSGVLHNIGLTFSLVFRLN